MSETGDLLTFLEKNDLGHYTKVLLDHVYSLDNLDILTERDLFKLRVTNKHEKLKLLGLGDLVKKAKEKLRIEEGGHGRSVSPPREFSATSSTANEYCREATIYLQHHAVDRIWPTARSKLAQDLHLSTAPPSAPRHKLYDVRLFDRLVAARPTTSPPKSRRPAGQWEPTLKVTPQPPADLYRRRPLSARQHRHHVEGSDAHTHGKSARSCAICTEHVSIDALGAGHWEFCEWTQVRVGSETLHSIEVWKPFKSADMIKIEHAYMRGDCFIRIQKEKIVFEKMKWGTKPVRRRKGQMAFPSLMEKEIVFPEKLEDNEKHFRQLEVNYLHSFTDLIVAEEQVKRRKLWDEEEETINGLRGGFRRKYEMICARERSEFEAMEEEDRLKISRESNIDYGALWELAGELAREELERRRREEEEREAARRALLEAQQRRQHQEYIPEDVELPEGPERSYEEIAADQLRLLEDMEAQRRLMIEKLAAAEQANFLKIAGRLHAQASVLLNCRTQNLSPLEGLRCPKCLDHDCQFLKTPWRNHWRHRGGALDLKQPKVGYGTLASLISHVNEVEYHEALTGHSVEHAHQYSSN